jgi:hypothetical protein
MKRKRARGNEDDHEIFITSTANTFNDIKMVATGARAVSARAISGSVRDERQLISRRRRRSHV